MKREFLKSLGIEDKDLIDKILDENSADIGKAKGEVEQYKTQIEDLKGQIKERDTQLGDLKKSVKDNEGLVNKITKLEEANKTTQQEYENKILQIQKTHAIESGVRDAKAKNVKAVMALLDMAKITYSEDKLEGLTEQLDSLKNDEGTNFLFIGEDKPPVPAGTTPSNPNANGGNTAPTSTNLAEAVAKALGK